VTHSQSFLFGLVGGLLAEFIFWAKFQKTFHKKKPDFVYSIFYWIFAILWIVIGGFLPWIYLATGMNINFLFCRHIGATAPIILKQLTSGKIDTM